MSSKNMGVKCVLSVASLLLLHVTSQCRGQSLSRVIKPGDQSALERQGRQLGDPLHDAVAGRICDFGVQDATTWCSWRPVSDEVLSRSSLPSQLTSWTLSMGANSLWVGGPRNDTSGDPRGGYAFHETSSQPGFDARMAVMESNAQEPTGASGKCLKFWYAIEGLSASELRVRVRNLQDTESMVIWQTRDTTRGDWKEGQVLYTFTDNHTLVLEGVPVEGVDPFNIFRGHIAVDDLGVREGQECIGLCSFEGGMCDWNNAATDDFDWKLGRGTQNPITGPPRDRNSGRSSLTGGAYVYIDSDFPRRPEDVARLESIEFQETDPTNPPCMRFYTFMSGRGVGSLRVLLQDVVTRRERVVWALARNQGARWLEAQLPLSSNTPFKIVFEGTVGTPRVGDIALDDITIVSGPCATLPTSASPPTSGDCTFEEGLCGWANPNVRQRLDDLDFIRIQSTENSFPSADHTTGKPNGHYMALESPEQKVEGDRAWLISPVMTGRRQVKCLSFWYLMFEPLTDELETKLGSLSAFIKREDASGAIILTPIWSLHNFQGLTWSFAQAPLRADGDFEVVLESVWGSAKSKGTLAVDDITIFDGNCPTVPDAAVVRAGDCTFTRGSCGWQNLTSDSNFYWNNASPSRRPVSMTDHTYGAQVGYIYFDVFNLNSRSQKLQLISPAIDPSADREPLCFTFWFSGFGSDGNTSLAVYQKQTDDGARINSIGSDIVQIWSHNIGLDALSGRWQFGQVPLLASTRFQLVVEGASFNGGYTLDDFKIYNGLCAKRPRDHPNFIRV
ncbi:MAM and LDL-receptor class A domain-containing protein 1 [Hyalella azteca]|uniref:MAM and LDL-receptor class A domain-containing protein 1 n=1 Tax=Hyalella azteca TaxID=294128 RepID=A0A8B7P6Y8_HYAAZ|nr:MAM and LDL-receptor class A domain-containing protein 1 [Hyalella azteca]